MQEVKPLMSRCMSVTAAFEPPLPGPWFQMYERVKDEPPVLETRRGKVWYLANDLFVVLPTTK